MKKLIFIFVILNFTVHSIFAVSKNTQLTKTNWTIAADIEKSELVIEHKNLGIVLKDIRLYLKEGNKWQKLSDFLIKIEENGIKIYTENPKTEWSFYIYTPGQIEITTTANEAKITATAPADKNRFPARMIDYSGRATPVAWKGTNEIVASYGGIQTKNISFLPAENPDVLYLSLGQVSALNMHCLFDRNSDTMIKFPKTTQMLRGTDEDQLQISISFSSDKISAKGWGLDTKAIFAYPDYYTKHLGVPNYKPMDDSRFKNPPVMWNSWTNYYDKITEADVVENVDWIAENFNDYGLEYMVIDDGPERGEEGEHYWISNWNKETFPHGPKWLTDYIKSKGLKAGLWVLPNVYAGALKDHPEWYLYDKDGNNIIVYNTPMLDYTNPNVLKFLTKMFTTLKGWGFEYYKFDYEMSSIEHIPNVDKSKLYNQSISPLEAYHNRLDVIRNAVGDDTFLEGCPAGAPLEGIGYYNSYFTGDDIYNSWLGMYPIFSSLNANLFLNHITNYVMLSEGISVSPKIDFEKAKSVFNDVVIRVALIREPNISSMGTTINEAHTIVTFAALSGTPFSSADRLPDLPEERINLLKKSLPTIPIIPMDLFSRGGYSNWDLFYEFTSETYKHNFPRIIDLKINAASGIYDVVAATNWTNKAKTRTISFKDKLGLDSQNSYLAFDFWNQKFLGVFNNTIELNIEPHDTRVVHIRKVLKRPQFLATNRHISGAYSIKALNWDDNKQILSGSSKTIDGVLYSLFVYVPNGFSILNIESDAEVVSNEVTNNVAKVVFDGHEDIIKWSLLFDK